MLPFANLSSDPDQEYFSDGLTEEILNQLAQINALSVTGRTSSFSFKGKNEDVRTIARKLGVGNLLEGSIRKEGRQLRITAQLVNGKDGAHLWSQTYDRELSGVFALQEEIAKDVASALSIKLDVGETRRAKGGTTTVDAWDKYLQAAALFWAKASTRNRLPGGRAESRSGDAGSSLRAGLGAAGVRIKVHAGVVTGTRRGPAPGSGSGGSAHRIHGAGQWAGKAHPP